MWMIKLSLNILLKYNLFKSYFKKIFSINFIIYLYGLWFFNFLYVIPVCIIAA